MALDDAVARRRLLTLGDIDVTAWEAVKGGQAGIHVDAMLQEDVNCLSRP